MTDCPLVTGTGWKYYLQNKLDGTGYSQADSILVQGTGSV